MLKSGVVIHPVARTFPTLIKTMLKVANYLPTNEAVAANTRFTTLVEARARKAYDRAIQTQTIGRRSHPLPIGSSWMRWYRAIRCRRRRKSSRGSLPTASFSSVRAQRPQLGHLPLLFTTRSANQRCISNCLKSYAPSSPTPTLHYHRSRRSKGCHTSPQSSPRVREVRMVSLVVWSESRQMRTSGTEDMLYREVSL
jgi:hypothetical protein